MPMKKKSPSTRRARARVVSGAPHGAGNRIRKTWAATVEALSAAEAQAERQLRRLLARNRLEPADVRTALASFRARVQKERRKAARQLDTRLSALQARLRRDGKTFGRAVDDAVRGTLVTLDIPSRREVSELTRKVDQLSRKIDGYRRPAARPRTARRGVSSGSSVPATAAAH